MGLAPDGIRGGGYVHAGASAREQAQRHTARAEKLTTEYAAAPCEDTRAKLEHAQDAVRRWTAGADGEVLVAHTLRELDRYGWTTLHDLRWPDRRDANLDHIALGPGGVVVIDTKNWTGQVHLRDGALRQNGHLRTKDVDGALAAAAAVTAQLQPHHRATVYAVLCLAGHDLPPTTTPSGLVVVGRTHLVEHLTSLPPRLTPYDVADVGRHLAHLLDRTNGPRRTPTRRQRHAPPKQQRTTATPPPATSWRRTPARRQAARRGPKVVSVLVLLASLWGFHHFITGTLADHLDRLATRVPVVVTTPAAPQPTTASTTASTTSG